MTRTPSRTEESESTTAKPAAPKSFPFLLQRKCACGGTPGADGECEECRRKRLGVQRRAANDAEVSSIPPVVRDLVNTPGRPLDASTRGSMEPRFGHDFGRVRIHADGPSALAARELNAEAFTIGHDIFFGTGRYRPAQTDGFRLLAHELAHTIQQEGSASGPQPFGSVDRPDSALEQEAERAATAAVTGSRAVVTGRPGRIGPQRQRTSGGAIVSRPIEGGRLQVVRTLEERNCSRVPQTETTSPGDLLYVDSEANAVGIRFRYCRGDVSVELDSSLNYGRLRGDAEQLARQLPQTILQGGDVTGQIQQAVEETSLSGRAGIALTVDGVLRAEAEGSTEQGINSRSYQVRGLLRITPRGWALELGARYRQVLDDFNGRETTITFTPRINVGPVQVGGEVQHTEEQPAGGTPTSRTTFGGTVSVETGRGVGFTLRGSSENGGSLSLSFGTVDRTQTVRDVPQVECYVCDCPPPVPRYRCTRVLDPTTERVVTQEAGREVVQLHFQYDSTQPADAAAYTQDMQQVAGLLNNRYTVQSIRGFASPEANVRYNQDLATRRAQRARTDLEAALAGTEAGAGIVLPSPDGVGELLGEGASGREVSNAQLARELSGRLSGLSTEEQFDLLGIEPSVRNDPAARADAEQRIQDFIQGASSSRPLGTRARWERIFPFLRRVEVTLTRPEVAVDNPVPERRLASDCDEETIRWAEQNMPPVPEGRRVPTGSGRC